MNAIPVHSLTPGKYYTDSVFLDDKYLLLTPDVPVTDDLIQLLSHWEYKEVFSSGMEVDRPISAQIGSEGGGSMVSGLEADAQESAALQQTNKVFTALVERVDKIFSLFVARGEVPIKDATAIVKDAIEEVKSNRQYILRLPEFHMPNKNYIVVHSMKTALIALGIGLQIKLPPHKLVELGMAGILHEIGMIKLPAKLYETSRRLESQELRAITAHTLLGFRILRAQGYPISVCMGVLNSHEHVDGSGYPQGLDAEKISLYGKIINVAGSYSALTAERPFREAIDGHTSVRELLQHGGTRYDKTVLQSLIRLISIYPLGSYVELSNRAKGMVVQTNPNNIKAPPVRLLIDPSGQPLRETPIVDTEKTEFAIKRNLTTQETKQIRSILV